MDRFLRIWLPLILLAMFVVIAIYVFNAIEVTELMETEKRAAPSLLSH